MGNTYGFVLGSVAVSLALVCSVCVYWKRENPYIRSRLPDILLFHNFSILVCAFLICWYIGTRPNFPCKLVLFTNVMSASTIGWGIVLRFWEYCARCRSAVIKANLRTIGMETACLDSFVVKMARHSFTVKVLIAGCIFFAVPGIFYLTPLKGDYAYNEQTETCIFPDSVVNIYRVFAYLQFAIIIVGAFVARNSKDAFLIRREMYVLIVMWIIANLANLLYYLMAPPNVQRHFVPVTINLLAGVVTLCISNFVPLYSAFTFNPKEPCGESFSDFEQLLTSDNFRNEFYEFLTRQFCAENLQFFEEVQLWKAQTIGPHRRQAAEQICKKFVEEDGVCQVHMVYEIKSKIQETMANSAEVPENIFDTACDALLRDMYINSFILFRRSCAFALTVVLEV